MSDRLCDVEASCAASSGGQSLCAVQETKAASREEIAALGEQMAALVRTVESRSGESQAIREQVSRLERGNVASNEEIAALGEEMVALKRADEQRTSESQAIQGQFRRLEKNDATKSEEFKALNERLRQLNERDAFRGDDLESLEDRLLNRISTEEPKALRKLEENCSRLTLQIQDLKRRVHAVETSRTQSGDTTEELTTVKEQLANMLQMDQLRSSEEKHARGEEFQALRSRLMSELDDAFEKRAAALTEKAAMIAQQRAQARLAEIEERVLSVQDASSSRGAASELTEAIDRRVALLERSILPAKGAPSLRESLAALEAEMARLTAAQKNDKAESAMRVCLQTVSERVDDLEGHVTRLQEAARAAPGEQDLQLIFQRLARVEQASSERPSPMVMAQRLERLEEASADGRLVAIVQRERAAFLQEARGHTTEAAGVVAAMVDALSQRLVQVERTFPQSIAEKLDNVSGRLANLKDSVKHFPTLTRRIEQLEAHGTDVQEIEIRLADLERSLGSLRASTGRDIHKSVKRRVGELAEERLREPPPPGGYAGRRELDDLRVVLQGLVDPRQGGAVRSSVPEQGKAHSPTQMAAEAMQRAPSPGTTGVARLTVGCVSNPVAAASSALQRRADVEGQSCQVAMQVTAVRPLAAPAVRPSSSSPLRETGAAGAAKASTVARPAVPIQGHQRDLPRVCTAVGFASPLKYGVGVVRNADNGCPRSAQEVDTCAVASPCNVASEAFPVAMPRGRAVCGGGADGHLVRVRTTPGAEPSHLGRLSPARTPRSVGIQDPVALPCGSKGSPVKGRSPTPTRLSTVLAISRSPTTPVRQQRRSIPVLVESVGSVAGTRSGEAIPSPQVPFADIAATALGTCGSPPCEQVSPARKSPTTILFASDSFRESCGVKVSAMANRSHAISIATPESDERVQAATKDGASPRPQPFAFRWDSASSLGAAYVRKELVEAGGTSPAVAEAEPSPGSRCGSSSRLSFHSQGGSSARLVVHAEECEEAASKSMDENLEYEDGEIIDGADAPVVAATEVHSPAAVAAAAAAAMERAAAAVAAVATVVGAPEDTGWEVESSTEANRREQEEDAKAREVAREEAKQEKEKEKVEEKREQEEKVQMLAEEEDEADDEEEEEDEDTGGAVQNRGTPALPPPVPLPWRGDGGASGGGIRLPWPAEGAPVEIVVERATGLRDVDPIGFWKPDPFCIITVSGRQGWRSRTESAPNTLAPVWDHRCQVPSLHAKDVVEFRIYDEDQRPAPLLATASLVVAQYLAASLPEFRCELPCTCSARAAGAEDATGGSALKRPAALRVRTRVLGELAIAAAKISAAAKAAAAADEVAKTALRSQTKLEMVEDVQEEEEEEDQEEREEAAQEEQQVSPNPWSFVVEESEEEDLEAEVEEEEEQEEQKQENEQEQEKEQEEEDERLQLEENSATQVLDVLSVASFSPMVAASNSSSADDEPSADLRHCRAEDEAREFSDDAIRLDADSSELQAASLSPFSPSNLSPAGSTLRAVEASAATRSVSGREDADVKSRSHRLDEVEEVSQLLVMSPAGSLGGSCSSSDEDSVTNASRPTPLVHGSDIASAAATRASWVSKAASAAVWSSPPKTGASSPQPWAAAAAAGSAPWPAPWMPVASTAPPADAEPTLLVSPTVMEPVELMELSDFSEPPSPAKQSMSPSTTPATPSPPWVASNHNHAEQDHGLVSGPPEADLWDDLLGGIAADVASAISPRGAAAAHDEASVSIVERVDQGGGRDDSHGDGARTASSGAARGSPTAVFHRPGPAGAGSSGEGCKASISSVFAPRPRLAPVSETSSETSSGLASVPLPD
eukprot:TRINITY_DN6736_c0_g3_i1.p1 TRINITY_DN6736_c0_g3~~TRINITY_DN6736_c0_g3_i1.p1  ORF type:complete len:2044 (+),score=532.10 TRINITY_DN6736_c0_g3_i1:647-6133(+)